SDGQSSSARGAPCCQYQWRSTTISAPTRYCGLSIKCRAALAMSWSDTSAALTSSRKEKDDMLSLLYDVQSSSKRTRIQHTISQGFLAFCGIIYSCSQLKVSRRDVS